MFRGRIQTLAACAVALALIVTAAASAAHKSPGVKGGSVGPGVAKPAPSSKSKPPSSKSKPPSSKSKPPSQPTPNPGASTDTPQGNSDDEQKEEVQELQDKKRQSLQREQTAKQKEGNNESAPKLAEGPGSGESVASQTDSQTQPSTPVGAGGQTGTGQDGGSGAEGGETPEQGDRDRSSPRGGARERADRGAPGSAGALASSAAVPGGSNPAASGASGTDGDQSPSQSSKGRTRPTVVERVIHEIPLAYRIALGSLIGLALLLSGVTVRERRRSLRTERDMMVDGLTGVGSRKALQNQLEAEWRRAERHQRPLGLLVLDLDDLKEINDAFGHAAGDELLRTSANSISQRVRSSDMVARLGGDEFVVLCPETPQSGLEQLAHALRDDFRKLKIGVSVGYAQRESFDRDPDDLMARADAAMYAHKRAGALR